MWACVFCQADHTEFFTERHKSAVGGCVFNARLSSLLNGCQRSINSPAHCQSAEEARKSAASVPSFICLCVTWLTVRLWRHNAYTPSLFLHMCTYCMWDETRQERSLRISVPVLVVIHFLLSVLFHFILWYYCYYFYI